MTRVRSVSLTALVSVLLLVAGCGLGSSAPSASGKVYATVGNQKITEKEVNTRLSLFQLLYPQSKATIQQHSTIVSITNEMVDETLLLAAAKKAKTTPKASEVKSDKTSLQTQLNGQTYPNQAAAQKAMKSLGLTQTDINNYINTVVTINDYLTKAVPTPTVTSKEIAAYYNANKSQFTTPEEYHLRHILVKTKAQAQAILKQLKAGASFSALAKKDSIDTGSAKNGGDLGFAPLSTYVTPFANAAAKLKVGQLSGVVQSQFGYHIIQLLGTKPASVQSLKSVTSQIQSTLQQQDRQNAIQALLTKLHSKTTVKVTVPKSAGTPAPSSGSTGTPSSGTSGSSGSSGSGSSGTSGSGTSGTGTSGTGTSGTGTSGTGTSGTGTSGTGTSGSGSGS